VTCLFDSFQLKKTMIRSFKENYVSRPSNLPIFVVPEGPVDLEIGCGVGLHPIKYAQQNPNRFLIAIEKTRNKYEKFQRRLEHHSQINNLHAVHADAVAWVTHFLVPNSISRCFILYPNPNPKNQARRWIRMPFMEKLLEVIKPGGEIIFRTNEKPYIDEVLFGAEHQWRLHILTNRIIPGNETPLTHFEKKYLMRNEVCYEARFQKP